MGGFGVDFGGVGARFWEVLGSMLEASGDNLGIRLLLENLLFRSILLASGSGWAGGVTRSAKNYRPCPITCLRFALIFWKNNETTEYASNLLRIIMCFGLERRDSMFRGTPVR